MSTLLCISMKPGKTTKSVHCAITGPCLCMRHRPSALRLYRFEKFT